MVNGVRHRMLGSRAQRRRLVAALAPLIASCASSSFGGSGVNSNAMAVKAQLPRFAAPGVPALGPRRNRGARAGMGQADSRWTAGPGRWPGVRMLYASVTTAGARLARELRERARAEVESRARSVSTRAAAPLGVCFLPAFVLLGIVPLVAGLVGSLGLLR